MTRSLLILSAVLMLTGCNDKANETPSTHSTPSEPTKTRTVIEFLESPEALDETWSKCRNDPGGLGKTADCVNAGYAKERLMMLLGRERAIKSLKH